jgi:hypothetical protein
MEAKMSFGNFGIDMNVNAGATITMGIDCTLICNPVTTSSGTATGNLIPMIPNFTTDGRNELSGKAFAWTGLSVGNPFVEELQFDVFDAQAGLKQEFKLATPIAQAADASYASDFGLSLDFEAATGEDLNKLGELVGINLSAAKVESSTPLSKSPKASAFTISPSTVRAPTASDPGQKAKFILVIDPVTYAGSYSVDSIELFRKKSSGPGAFVLEAVPGICGRIAPTSGQSIFECESVLPASWIGAQAIIPFAKARLFGVTLPVLLELGEDVKASVTVDTAAMTITPSTASLAGGATQQFDATVTGLSNTSVSWTATGGTITSNGFYTAGSTPGTYQVTATSSAQPSLTATAVVQIAGGEAGEIIVRPLRRTVSAGQSQQFTASFVENIEIDDGVLPPQVVWTATGGTITSTGLYTAGSTPGTYMVRATLSSNSALTASAIVDIPNEDAAKVYFIGDFGRKPSTVQASTSGTIGPRDQFEEQFSESDNADSTITSTYTALSAGLVADAATSLSRDAHSVITRANAGLTFDISAEEDQGAATRFNDTLLVSGSALGTVVASLEVGERWSVGATFASSEFNVTFYVDEPVILHWAFDPQGSSCGVSATLERRATLSYVVQATGSFEKDIALESGVYRMSVTAACGSPIEENGILNYSGAARFSTNFRFRKP